MHFPQSVSALLHCRLPTPGWEWSRDACFGLSQLSLGGYKLTLQQMLMSKESGVRYMQRSVNFPHEADMRKLFYKKKVALVGRGSSLSGRAWGKLIDDHDVVVRVNHVSNDSLSETEDTNLSNPKYIRTVIERMHKAALGTAGSQVFDAAAIATEEPLPEYTWPEGTDFPETQTLHTVARKAYSLLQEKNYSGARAEIKNYTVYPRIPKQQTKDMGTRTDIVVSCSSMYPGCLPFGDISFSGLWIFLDCCQRQHAQAIRHSPVRLHAQS